jgi:hypothetical protein
MYRNIAFRMLFAAPLFVASQAMADVSMDFDIVTNQFSKPSMNFVFKDGKFVWDRKPVTTGFRASGDISREWEWLPTVALAPNGKGGKPLQGIMPSSRRWSHADSITFPANFLAAYQDNYAGHCAKHGGSEKKIFSGLTTSFTFIRYYHERNRPPEVGSEVGNKKIARTVTMPMTVVCGAMPKRVPGVAFKVEQVKLYTIPASPKCGKPVRLIAEFHTNKAGKVNFTLHRHDGEKQNASVDVGPAGDGFAKRWSKEYVYKSDIERSYKVSVKGQDLPAQWVAIRVNCGAKSDHGVAENLVQ